MTSDDIPLPQRAAALLAIDPWGLGGASLRGPSGSGQSAWLETFRALMPEPNRRRLPPQIGEGALLGGLDLAATLAAGRPVAERGLLVEANGGTLVVPMAERLSSSVAHHIAAVLDHGERIVERDGIGTRLETRFVVVALDEGIGDERPVMALTDRLAFPIRFEGVSRDADMVSHTPAEAASARTRLSEVTIGDEALEALVAAGLALGVPSLRVAAFAIKAAKAAAALAGRDHVARDDAELAAALVIAPRATCLPAEQTDEAPPPNDAPPPPDEPRSDDDASADTQDAAPLADSVVEAARAAIPADLLALLGAASQASRHSASGHAGVARQSARRGRPAGVRRGMPGHGARLALVETLRAAAPWQQLRRRDAAGASSQRVLVRRDDFRVGRFKEKSETLTIFVVDASGSAALHRLAEVKGAVELVLADCYVRRDGVALIAFRGSRAELVLPPTRSLVRAKRALAGLPGGGGTPLAAAIDAAALVADSARRKGQVPLVVFLTDGKGNVGRNGQPGRLEAERDVAAAALQFRTTGAAALVLDIAQRPGEPALRLAAATGARYIPLPYADARRVSEAVLAAGPVA